MAGFYSAALSKIPALHWPGLSPPCTAGLATLTHTPSPMGFLNEVCGRPPSEKPFVLLVTGYPTADCQVPAYAGIKKSLPKICSWL